MQSNEPQTSVRQKELALARTHSNDQRWEDAYDIGYKWFKADPTDADALNLIAHIMLNTDKVAIAYPLLK